MSRCSPDERDQILLVMAGHDLKGILGSVCILLSGYLQEAGKYVTVSEVRNFTARVEKLQFAGTEMVAFLDEMLAMPGQESSAVEPLNALMQLVCAKNKLEMQAASYASLTNTN
jgi:hypothetical protein